LEIDVELAVTGDAPVPVTFGFHPYVTLPGLDRSQWLVELPVTSRMVLDERMLPTARASRSGSHRRRSASAPSTTPSTAWPIQPSSPWPEPAGA
jgi:galactose mutarotase-like enzyme